MPPHPPFGFMLQLESTCVCGVSALTLIENSIVGTNDKTRPPGHAGSLLNLARSPFYSPDHCVACRHVTEIAAYVVYRTASQYPPENSIQMRLPSGHRIAITVSVLDEQSEDEMTTAEKDTHNG